MHEAQQHLEQVHKKTQQIVSSTPKPQCKLFPPIYDISAKSFLSFLGELKVGCTDQKQQESEEDDCGDRLLRNSWYNDYGVSGSRTDLIDFLHKTLSDVHNALVTQREVVFKSSAASLLCTSWGPVESDVPQ